MGRPVADGAIRIPCKSLQGFFEAYFDMLKPIHKLSSKEIKLIATFVRFRHELSKTVLDPDLCDEYMMTQDVRNKIRTECGMSKQSFRIHMVNLRKNKVIINNRINPKLIPNMSDDGSFRLMLYFDISGNGQGEV